MKRIKVVAGICLMVQSVVFFVLFVIYWRRSRSLGKTLAVFSSLGGVCGAMMVLGEMKQKRIRTAIDRELQTFDRDFEEIFGPDEVTVSFSDEDG